MISRTDKEMKQLYAHIIYGLLNRNKSDYVIFEPEEWQNIIDANISIMYRDTEDGGFELQTCELDENLQH